MPETGDPILPRPLPRGVADPAAARGFLSDGDGPVIAIDLADGRVIWRSEVVARPILAASGRVFAVRPVGDTSPGLLHLEILDAESGRQSLSRGLGPLGDAPGPAHSAAPELFPALVGAVFTLEWRLPGGYAGGAPPAVGIAERFDAPATGRFELDLTTGALSAGPASAPTRDPVALASWAYRRDGSWRTTGWRSGGGLARLDLDESERPPRLRLELWDRVGGSRLRATDLLEGPDLEPTVTADGAHLLLRRTAPPGDRWHLYEVATGRPVAALPHEAGSDLPTVVGDRLVHLLAPPGEAGARSAIRAVDVESGRTLWTRPLSAIAATRPPPLPR